MINILFLIDRFDHERAGTESQVAQLIKLLDKKKFNLHVIVLHKSKCLEQICAESDVSFFEFKRSSLSFWGIVKKLKTHAKKNDIDIIHTYFIDSIFIGSIHSFLMPSVLLITSRRDLGYWYTPAKRLFLYFSNMITDRILANSYSVKNNIISNEKANPSKVDVIFNGIDINKYYDFGLRAGTTDSLRQQLSIARNDIVFGFVGNLRPVKRPLDFINALVILNKTFTSWKAFVLGDGILKKEMQLKIEKNNLSEKIFLLGSVDNAFEYYAIMDIGVICSGSEGFPNSVLEMVASGVPVIGTNTGGISEIVNVAGGVLVSVGDVLQLAKSMLELASNKTIRDQINDNYCQYIKKFDWKVIIPQYGNYYISLFSGGRKGGGNNV